MTIEMLDELDELEETAGYLLASWSSVVLTSPADIAHPHCDVPSCGSLAFVGLKTQARRVTVCYNHYEALRSRAEGLGLSTPSRSRSKTA